MSDEELEKVHLYLLYDDVLKSFVGIS
jgi:hypothetical protein